MATNNWVRNNIYTSTPLGSPASDRLAKASGVKIISTDNNGRQVVPLGTSIKEDKYMSFEKFWNGVTSNDGISRSFKYQMFDLMDKTMMEASRALDVYADEMFNVGFIDNPLEIISDNRLLKDFITKVFKQNKVFQRCRADGRQVVKDGDFAYEIKTTRQYNDSHFIGKNSKPLSVDEIQLIPRRAKTWEIVYSGYDKVPLFYQDILYDSKNEQIKDNTKADKYYPWNFIQFSVFNYDNYPYGRGLLEKVSIAFDRLATMETLLALARASKLEKTAIYVPVDETNPEAAMDRLQSMKNQLKNTMFINAAENGANNNSYNRISSLNEQIFIPAMKDFKVETLKSDIELGGIDDVKYFQDQAFNGTGLPRSFFLNDDSNTEIHAGALKEQYAMFARSLQPYTLACLDGYLRLAETVATLGGFDLSKPSNKFKIIIKEPIQFKQDILEQYFSILNTTIDSLEKYKQQLDGDNEWTLSLKNIKDLTIKLGLPVEIANLFFSTFKKSNSKDGNISMDNNINVNDNISVDDDEPLIDPKQEESPQSQAEFEAYSGNNASLYLLLDSRNRSNLMTQLESLHGNKVEDGKQKLIESTKSSLIKYFG